MQTVGCILQSKHRQPDAALWRGTAEQFHADIGRPALRDGSQCVAAHAASEDHEGSV